VDRPHENADKTYAESKQLRQLSSSGKEILHAMLSESA
jgi:hypothetical protein